MLQSNQQPPSGVHDAQKQSTYSHFVILTTAPLCSCSTNVVCIRISGELAGLGQSLPRLAAFSIITSISSYLIHNYLSLLIISSSSYPYSHPTISYVQSLTPPLNSILQAWQQEVRICFGYSSCAKRVMLLAGACVYFYVNMCVFIGVILLKCHD